MPQKLTRSPRQNVNAPQNNLKKIPRKSAPRNTGTCQATVTTDRFKTYDAKEFECIPMQKCPSIAASYSDFSKIQTSSRRTILPSACCARW